jgi:hypothetical protein
MSEDGARPSVILVREWEQQMSSSGCCGRLEGDMLSFGGERCFPERRDKMERMGPLYRDLRSFYGDDIEITVVDPRNMITLVPLVIRDAHAHGAGIWQAVRTLSGVTITSVIANGRLLSRRGWPELAEVQAALGHAGGEREVAGGVA